MQPVLSFEPGPLSGLPSPAVGPGGPKIDRKIRGKIYLFILSKLYSGGLSGAGILTAVGVAVVWLLAADLYFSGLDLRTTADARWTTNDAIPFSIQGPARPTRWGGGNGGGVHRVPVTRCCAECRRKKNIN